MNFIYSVYISLNFIAKVKCSSFEAERCRTLSGDTCQRSPGGVECLCSNNDSFSGPCGPPSCREFAPIHCQNQICIEDPHPRCLYAREYFETLSRGGVFYNRKNIYLYIYTLNVSYFTRQVQLLRRLVIRLIVGIFGHSTFWGWSNINESYTISEETCKIFFLFFI